MSVRAGAGGKPAGRQRVVVEVPASAANLGAGYDALALALEITNRVEVDVVDDPGLEISIEGEGADSLPRNRDNRFVAALETGLRPARHDLPDGLRIRMHNDIPLTRGLGSSAAATIAGLVAANALLGEEADTRALLAPAIALEGHPDNAAAALLGGLVAVADVDGTAEAVRLDPPDVAVVLYVPELQLRTADMRAVLPRDVPREDAVFNLGRVAVGVAGIAAGRTELLSALTQDRLHQPYRARRFPAFPRLIAAARKAGALGACLAGSGSTVIAFVAPDGPLDEVAGALARSARESRVEGRLVKTRPRATGATVLEAG